MDENILKLRVGIFVLIAIVLLGILISVNSEGWSTQYTVFVNPTNAPNVTVGTPIRKNGVLIGRVKEVTPEDDHVRLRLGINDNVRIYENEVCSIGANGVLGDSVVEFVTMQKQERGQPLQDNDEVSRIAIKKSLVDAVKIVQNIAPQLEKTLQAAQQTLATVNEGSDAVRDLADTIRLKIDSDENEIKLLIADIRQFSQKAEATADSVNRMFENFNDFLGDPEMKSQFRQIILEVPMMLQEARLTIADLRETTRTYQSIPEDISEIKASILPFFTALSERGPEILNRVNSAVVKIDHFATQASVVTDILRDFNESDNSIKRLLNDDGEIYRSFFITARNIENVSYKLGPLMDDIRVFGDTLARNPGNILREAISPKKSKYKATPGIFRSSFDY